MKASEKSKTIYDGLLDRGVSRRDFMKMCTMLAATLGLGYADRGKVASAMETHERIPVIWLQLMDCTGCSESFIRTAHPAADHVLLDLISLEYSELLSAASGERVEDARKAVMENYPGGYILVVEGNVTEDEFLTVAGHSARETLIETAENAMAIIAYGSCASWGGIAKAAPNPTNAKAVHEVLTDKPIIKVPGCPPIAEVMTGVVAHLLTFDELPELDQQGRPKAFYRLRVHDKCNRRAYFDSGLFVESFDDEGAKIGYCLYKVGCAGPTTYNSCAEMRWNGGVSYPIQSGNPCIGCSEDRFWDSGPFFERRVSIPRTQTTVDPLIIGAGVIGVGTAGIATHAAVTAAQKSRAKKSDDASDLDDKKGE